MVLLFVIVTMIVTGILVCIFIAKMNRTPEEKGHSTMQGNQSTLKEQKNETTRQPNNPGLENYATSNGYKEANSKIKTNIFK
jgi:hypothetical protein